MDKWEREGPATSPLCDGKRNTDTTRAGGEHCRQSGLPGAGQVAHKNAMLLLGKAVGRAVGRTVGRAVGRAVGKAVGRAPGWFLDLCRVDA